MRILFGSFRGLFASVRTRSQTIRNLGLVGLRVSRRVYPSNIVWNDALSWTVFHFVKFLTYEFALTGVFYFLLMWLIIKITSGDTWYSSFLSLSLVDIASWVSGDKLAFAAPIIEWILTLSGPETINQNLNIVKPIFEAWGIATLGWIISSVYHHWVEFMMVWVSLYDNTLGTFQTISNYLGFGYGVFTYFVTMEVSEVFSAIININHPTFSVFERIAATRAWGTITFFYEWYCSIFTGLLPTDWAYAQAYVEPAPVAIPEIDTPATNLDTDAQGDEVEESDDESDPSTPVVPVREQLSDHWLNSPFMRASLIIFHSWVVYSVVKRVVVVAISISN
jgi:hypothetical protein